MRKQPDSTNSNLVLNGDFQQNYAIWKALNNEREFQVKGDTWQGKNIKYAQLKNEASVFQTLKVEVEPAEGARYHLRFLYENTHKAVLGSVLIGKKGVDDRDKLRIDLPATGGGAGANPLALDLRELSRHVPLDLVLHKGDDLDITLISPKQAPEDSSFAAIRLTCIKLHVELAPLQLLRWINDKQRFDPGQVLHLCLGATQEHVHQLKFEVHPDSHWVDTEAALWADDNPQEAMMTSPELGVNQGIELPWLLYCPEMEGAAPYLFELNIYSKYTAAPYPIAVSLGHHRLKLNVLNGATFWPVLEYGQSVPLLVQVLSHYTGKPVPGVEVTWRLGEKELFLGTSDGEGKAGFDYRPDTYGLQTIGVSVPSPYYEDPVVQQSLEILVLKDDPLSAVQVRFESGEAAIWGEKTGYPDRGSTYTFTLIIPEDSPLLDTQIAVEWSEGWHGPEDLDITSVPDFGEYKDVTGTELVWTLDCGDVRDAPFGLFLSCPMLQRDSRDNAMSLARNNLKIGQVREANKSPAVDEGDSVYCMVQVLTLDNEPALNVRVDWTWPNGGVTTYTGVGGWASAFHKPAAAGPYEMVAHIQVREGASPLTYPFSIDALANSEWKDDIEFFLDEHPVDTMTLGILCRRGKSHTFRIAPKNSESPFIGRMITLDWRKGVDPDLGLVFDPPLGTAESLPREGLEWAITSGSTLSGLFELEVQSGYLPRKRELTGRLMAEKFDDEVTLVFDQMGSQIGRSTLYPCIGAVHQLTLLPRAFSPLQGLEVLWSELPTGPFPERIEITPDTRTLVLITAGGARYTFDCSASSGKTQLALLFNLYEMNFKTSDQVFQLDHNKLKVGAVRQAAIDPVLSKGERAWLEIQFLSWFTGLPARGMPVQWHDGTSALTRSETDPDGWTGHEYESQVPGLNLVMAQAGNPYDGSSVGEDFEVFVLDHDPWQDLRVETQDALDARTWAASTFFPRRNGQFDFVISANEDSYLQGQSLALGLTGTGPGELGLKMGPVTFGQWRPLVDSLPFTLTAGDEKDGSFSFRLAASRLLSLSPRNAVSLGAASKAIKMSAINSTSQALDWGSVIEAEVKVVSALSGKSLVGMAVFWKGADLEPVLTRTNFYGVAKIRFTPTIPGLGQVTAMAGEDAASQSLTFFYTVNEPRKISEMACPELTGYRGREVSAYVIVVSNRTGKALQGVAVEWQFKDVSLKPSVTDINGKASIQFSLPGGRGERALIASVGGAEFGRDAARLMFSLLPAEIAELTLSRPVVLIGSSLTADVRVENSQQEAQVVWSFTGLPDSTSAIDDQGMATQSFMPTQIPDGNFANVSATVHGGTDDASTRSTDVWVSSTSNPVYGNSLTFINDTIVLLPLHLTVGVRQNRDIAVSIQVKESLAGSELAIFCMLPDVTFDPPAGKYHKVDEWFTWKMNIQAPVGKDFAAVICARGVSGSTGLKCRVIEQGPAPDFFIEPDDR